MDSDEPYSNDSPIDESSFVEIASDPLSWNDVKPHTDYDVKSSGGREKAWRDSLSEIDNLRKNIYEACGKEVPSLDGDNEGDTTKPTHEEIINLFFGQRSKIYQVFQDKLKWSYPFFLRFIGTTLVLGYSGWSIKELHDIRTRLIFAGEGSQMHPGILDHDVYVDCWNKINNLDGMNMSVRISPTGEGEPFWKQLVDAFNKISRRLAIFGRFGPQSYIDDDDKTHFELPPKGWINSLLKCYKHPKDNRWGSVLHTFLLPGCLFIVCLMYEEKGDTAESCTRQMISAVMFGSNESRVPDLTNITFNFDRGYQTLSLIVYILKAGGSIHCSSKQVKWIPFVLDEHLVGNNDSRELVKKSGIAMLKLKQCMVPLGRGNAPVKLTVAVYRNGRGNACLFMTTNLHSHCWDIVVQSTPQARLHKRVMDNEDENAKEILEQEGFRWENISIAGEDEEEIEMKAIYDKAFELFKGLGVEMVTLEQNNPSWFAARAGLVFTSTSANSIIEVIKNHRNEYLELHSDQKDDVNRVLCFARKNYVIEEDEDSSSTSTSDDAPPQCVEDTLMTRENMSDAERGHYDRIRIEQKDSSDSRTGTGQPQADTIDDTDSESDSEANNNDGNRTDIATTVLSNLRNENEAYLRGFLLSIRSDIVKDNASSEAMRKKISSWIEQPPHMRQFIGMNLQQIKEAYKELFHKNPPQAQSKKQDMINAIVSKQQSPDLHSLDASPTKNYKQAALDSVLKSGFGMKPLPKKAQADCNEGHAAETLISTNAFDVFPAVHGTFEVGLVRRKDKPFLQGSIDRLFLRNKNNDDYRLIPVEIKTRVSAANVQHEEERVKSLDRVLNNSQERTRNFVSSKSQYVHQLIEYDKERVQLLHHCVVCGSDVCYFLIGKKDGDIMDRVALGVDRELAKSYEKILSTVYDDVFKCYTKEDISKGLDHLTEEESNRLSNAIESIKDMIPDLHTFNDRFCLHRFITEKCLPLPNASIIPFICSEWNTKKPAGDMNTQMAWELNPPNPVPTPHTEAVKRAGIMLPTHQIHRCFQVVGANLDLSTYKTLKQYRDARNQERSLRSSVGDIILALFRMADRISTTERQLHRNTTASNRSSFRIDTQAFATKMKINTSNIKDYTNIVAPITGTTPVRGVESYYQTGHADASTARRANCKGRALRLVDPKKCGITFSCQICAANNIQSKADLVCFECKGFFCGKSHCKEEEEDFGAFYTGRTRRLNEKKPKNVKDAKAKMVKELVFFYRSCFDLAHENARLQDSQHLEQATVDVSQEGEVMLSRGTVCRFSNTAESNSTESTKQKKKRRKSL